MAAIHIGFVEESFKLCVGHDIFQNDGVAYSRRNWNGTAACGLSEAFQVILKSPDDALLTLDEQPVFHRKGMLPVYRMTADCSLPITLQHVGMVTGDDCLKYGDILLRSPATELESNVPAAIYVQVDVPDGTSAGVYTGSLCVYRSVGFSGEEKLEKLTFSIEVFECVFPKPEQRRFYLDLWQHPANIARKAEVPLWSDRHFTLLEPYLRLLADIGQRAITAIVSEIPWCGQAGFMEHRCTTDLYEYSMVRVFREENDCIRVDFSILERYIQLCYHCGFRTDSEIEVFGLVNIWRFDDYGYGGPAKDYPEAIRICVRERDGSYGYLSSVSEIDQYVQALEAYFKQNGRLKYVRVVADEPADIQRFRCSLEHLKKVAPGFRYKAAINHAEFVGEFLEQIDDFVPIYDCLIAENSVLQALRATMPEKRFLWYVCCVPAFPNFFIGSSLLEGRAVGALTYVEGLDGFLRWDFTVWNEEPRRDLRYPRFPCGDMNFVYPAGDMSPLLSLRYQALKRGLEDYELLVLLAERGHRDLAEELSAMIVKGKGLSEAADSVGDLLSLDFQDYSLVRRRALETLASS